MIVRSAPILSLALILGLAPCLAPRASASPSAGGVQRAFEGSTGRLELSRGRALLVADAGVMPVGIRTGPLPIDPSGHLELAPGAMATLRWPGLGSVRLSGPTSMAWEATEDSMVWRFGSLRAADVEWRSGTVRADLPGAWRVKVQPAALSIRALPGGGTKLEHHAGHPAHAAWIGGSGSAPPPLAIGPGQSLRLQGEVHVAPAPDHTASAPRWDACSWPWGEGGIPDQPDFGFEGPPSWKELDWPWAPGAIDAEPWERWDWPWSPENTANDLAPSTTFDTPPAVPPKLGSASPPSLESPSRTEGGAALKSADGAGPGRGDSAIGRPENTLDESRGNVVREPWRGLDQEQLETFPGFRAQISPDLIVEELLGGKSRIRVTAEAGRAVWIFTGHLDMRIFPGGSVMLDQTGELRSYMGQVRILTGQRGGIL